jgi:hypothetical protein
MILNDEQLYLCGGFSREEIDRQMGELMMMGKQR